MLSILTFKRGGLALLFGCCLLTLSACGNSKPPKKEPTKPPVIKIDEHVQGLTKSGLVQICNGQGPADPSKQDETRGLNAGARCGVCRTKLIGNEYVRSCEYSGSSTGAYDCVPVKELVKRKLVLGSGLSTLENPTETVKVNGKDVLKKELQGICVPVPKQCTQIGDHCDNGLIPFLPIDDTEAAEPTPTTDTSKQYIYWAGGASVSGTNFTCVGPGNGTNDYCMDQCSPVGIAGIAKAECGRGQVCVKNQLLKSGTTPGSLDLGDYEEEGQKYITQAWEKLCKEKGDGPCTGVAPGKDFPIIPSGLGGGLLTAMGVCVDSVCNPNNDFADQCSQPDERCLSQIHNPLPANPPKGAINNEWDWPECKKPTTPPSKKIGDSCKSSEECMGGEQVSCIQGFCLEWCDKQKACSGTSKCELLGELDLDSPYAFDKGICVKPGTKSCDPSKSTDPSDSTALGCASTESCKPINLNFGLCSTKDPARTKKEFAECNLAKDDCEEGLTCSALGPFESGDLSMSKVGRCMRTCPFNLTSKVSPNTWCSDIGSKQSPPLAKTDTSLFKCMQTDATTQFTGVCSLNCTLEDYKAGKQLQFGTEKLQCGVSLASMLTYQLPPKGSLKLGEDCSSDPDGCGPGLGCAPGVVATTTGLLSDNNPTCKKICSPDPRSPFQCDSADDICAGPGSLNSFMVSGSTPTKGQYDSKKIAPALALAKAGLCIPPLK